MTAHQVTLSASLTIKEMEPAPGACCPPRAAVQLKATLSCPRRWQGRGRKGLRLGLGRELTFGLFSKDVLKDLAQGPAMLLVLSPRQLDPHIKGGAELEGGAERTQGVSHMPTPPPGPLGELSGGPGPRASPLSGSRSSPGSLQGAREEHGEQSGGQGRRTTAVL